MGVVPIQSGGGLTEEQCAKWVEDYGNLPLPSDVDDIADLVNYIVRSESLPTITKTKILRVMNSLLPMMIVDLYGKLSEDTRSKLSRDFNSYVFKDDWLCAVPYQRESYKFPTKFLKTYIILMSKYNSDHLDTVVGKISAGEWTKIAYDQELITSLSQNQQDSTIFLYNEFVEFYFKNLSKHPDDWFIWSLNQLASKESLPTNVFPNFMKYGALYKTQEYDSNSDDDDDEKDSHDDRKEQKENHAQEAKQLREERLHMVSQAIAEKVDVKVISDYVENSNNKVSIAFFQSYGFFKEPSRYLSDMLSAIDTAGYRSKPFWLKEIKFLINGEQIPTDILHKNLDAIMKVGSALLPDLTSQNLLSVDPDLFGRIQQFSATKDLSIILSSDKAILLIDLFKKTISESANRIVTFDKLQALSWQTAERLLVLEKLCSISEKAARTVVHAFSHVQPPPYKLFERLIKKFGNCIDDNGVINNDKNLIYLYAKYGFAVQGNLSESSVADALKEVYSDVLTSMQWVNDNIKLSDRALLVDYTQNQKNYNDALTTEIPTGRSRNFKLDQIDRIFSRVPKTTKDVYFWRGVKVTVDDLEFTRPILNSISYSFSVAQDFAGMNGTVLRVKLPPGVPIIALETISEYAREREVLLPRNSMFKFIDKTDKFVDVEFKGTYFDLITLSRLRPKRKRITVDEQVEKVFSSCKIDPLPVIKDLQSRLSSIENTKNVIFETEKRLMHCIIDLKLKGEVEDEEQVLTKSILRLRQLLTDQTRYVRNSGLVRNQEYVEMVDAVVNYITSTISSEILDIYSTDRVHKQPRLNL